MSPMKQLLITFTIMLAIVSSVGWYTSSKYYKNELAGAAKSLDAVNWFFDEFVEDTEKQIIELTERVHEVKTLSVKLTSAFHVREEELLQEIDELKFLTFGELPGPPYHTTLWNTSLTSERGSPMIINQDIYEVLFSLGDNPNNVVWKQQILGLPTSSKVKALLTKLIKGIQGRIWFNTGLPDSNCLVFQQCLYLLERFGMPPLCLAHPCIDGDFSDRPYTMGHIASMKVGEVSEVVDGTNFSVAGTLSGRTKCR